MGEEPEDIVFEMGQNDMEQREVVAKTFASLKPTEEYIAEIKATITKIQKTMHETEVDDEEDNLRTRTVAKLASDLEYTCRFEESVEREEKVKELYVLWSARIDSLREKVKTNLPKIKKEARKRR